MNLPTIIITSIIALVVIAIIIKGIKDRKNGKGGCSCGCSCSGCAMSNSCHQTDDETKS